MKHGARVDEELEREAAEAARPNPSVRADQWPDPEDPATLPGETDPEPPTS
jgi:hypothetical protein